jgi:ornithine cyclodeaminase/alanine dehydrogenase-like protein (mu-crystallin family)
LLHFEDPTGDVHIEYGAIRGDDYYLVEVASGLYENVDRGLPVSDGSMLLYDRRTGEMPAMLLDRGWLTELRTGAAGAVAADGISQTTHHGECAPGPAAGHLDRDDMVESGEIGADPSLGRTSPDQITVADLTGVAVRDIQVAKMARETLGCRP